MPDQGPCENCGATVQHWGLLNHAGHKTAEATFCPVCYPDVADAFAVPEKAGAAA